MKLEKFDKVGRGTRTRYIANVKDVAGSEDYQLVVAGSDARIKRILKDTDFDINIDPKAAEDEWTEIQKTVWEEQKATLSSLASLENVSSFFKSQLPNPSIDNSIFISLRRIRGEGSLYRVALRFGLPRGQSIYVSLPWVCQCYCTAEPESGDTDLFLSINSTTAIPVASSRLSGTQIDSINYGGFCWPWSNFIPYFRVYGYTATVVRLYYGGWGTTL